MHTYYLYRYIDNRTNQVIYVGKTKRPVPERLKEHEAETKFRPFLPFCRIEYYPILGQVNMDIHEKYWIHTLMPKLNDVDKVLTEKNIPLNLTLKQSLWRPYHKQTFEKPFLRKKPKKEIQTSNTEDLDQKWENAQTYLDFVSDLYFHDHLDIQNKMAKIPWDLLKYPLPDSIRIQNTWHSFYTRIDSQYLYQNISEIKILIREGNQICEEIRKELTKQRLTESE